MFSSDPFQRLTAGDTFSRTFHIFVARYHLFMIITAVIFVPMAFMMVSYFQFVGTSMHTMLDAMNSMDTVATMDSSGYNNSGDATGYDSYSGFASQASSTVDDPVADAMLRFGSQFILEYIALLIFAIAGEGAMSYAVAELYAGRDPSWLDCLKKGFSRWCDLFGSAFLVGFAVGFGNVFVQLIAGGLVSANNGFMSFLAFIIFVVWMVAITYIMVSLMILAPVIIVEGKGPIFSIKRCWALSWNNRCYIFCTSFCLGIANYVSQLILTSILFSTGGPDAVFSTGGALLVLLPSMFFLPLTVIAKTVVYLNIRVQHEGMNHSVLVGELYGESPSSKESKYALVDRSDDV